MRSKSNFVTKLLPGRVKRVILCLRARLVVALVNCTVTWHGGVQATENKKGSWRKFKTFWM